MIALLWMLACSDVELEFVPPIPDAPFDNKLAIDGEMCTSSTESMVFPLRVLFLVDASESMRLSDPPDPITGETARERAVREVAEDLLDGATDAEIAVIRFSAEAQSLTVQSAPDGSLLGYFTDDLNLVRDSLPLLANTDRTTNYINALSEAQTQIRDALTRSDREAAARTTYQVILVSDGIPDVESGGSDTILETVDDIVRLGEVFHLQRMGFSTAFISTGNGVVDRRAEELLREMSERGNGTYRSFASGGSLNFLHVDLTALERVFTLDSLVAYNLNALPREAGFLLDSDGDGLPDIEEIASSAFDPDTDRDGCRDSIESAFEGSGLDPSDPTDCRCYVPEWCFDADADGLCDNGCTDADGDQLCDCIDEDGDGVCDPENYLDTDGDGLVDCEERWTGTNNRAADTDGDGILDFHELRFGTSPDIDDRLDDADWDVTTNGDEIRTGTDPNHAAPEGRYETAYRYEIDERRWDVGRTCYDFSIGNITLLEMPEPTGVVGDGPAGQGYSGYNRVLLVGSEVPFDDQDAPGQFVLACVEAAVIEEGNYRNPPSGRMRVGPEDFVNLRSFDPALHCRRPGGLP